MAVKTYNLFISHSWTYSDAYERLVEMLRQRPYFSFKNYSVPKDDPIHRAGTARELREAIRHQMQPTHVVLVLAGVYSTYSRWINEEIDLAKGMRKPILGIAPWGAKKISSYVRKHADLIVGWNTDSVVQAIRKLAR